MSPTGPEVADVNQFEAAVNAVQTAPAALPDTTRGELVAKAQKVMENARLNTQNQGLLLRSILRVDIALHALRAEPTTDLRKVALTSVRTDLESRVGSYEARGRSILGAYVDTATDVYTSGLRPQFTPGGTPDWGRAGTSGVITAAATAGLVVTAAGTYGAIAGYDGDETPKTFGDRIKRILGRLILPITSLLGLIGLGSYAAKRSEGLRTPELREERNYVISPSTLMYTLRGSMTLGRTSPGGELLVSKGGNSFRMIFDRDATLPPPPGPAEETLGSMIERAYTSASAGSGLGVEQGGALGGIVTPESFVITEGGIDSIFTELNKPEAVTDPNGLVATVPLRFRLAQMTPSQMAFIRRCIARGCTVTSTDDGTVMVQTKIRLKKETVTAPPLVVEGPLRGDLRTLPVGRRLFSHPVATPLVFGTGGGAQTLGVANESEITIATGLKLRRRSNAVVEIDVGATAAPGTYTLNPGPNAITFVIAGMRAEADVVSDLDSPTGDARVAAGELAALDVARLATHTGDPATHADIAPKLRIINAVAHPHATTSSRVTDALQRILDSVGGATKLKDKEFPVSGGRKWKLRVVSGQLAFELLPATPAIETLTTARNDLVVGRTYRIAIPAGTKRIIVSDRNLNVGGLTIDTTTDSSLEKGEVWGTYVAPAGPASLRVVDDSGTLYLHMTIRNSHRNSTIRVRFDAKTNAEIGVGDLGTRSPDYGIQP